MTIDPKSLTSEERALVDHQAFRYHSDWSPKARYKTALNYCEPLIEARRALFAKSEGEAKVCPNCGELAAEGHLTKYRTLDDVLVRDFNCHHKKVEAAVARKVVDHEERMRHEFSPAQPEPSTPSCYTKLQPEPEAPSEICPRCHGVVDPEAPHRQRQRNAPDTFTCEPAEPAAPGEMPEAVRLAIKIVNKRAEEFAHYDQARDAEECCFVANALESWARTNSQPVGITEELERVLESAEYDAGASDSMGLSVAAAKTRACIAAVRSYYGSGKVEGRKG